MTEKEPEDIQKHMIGTYTSLRIGLVVIAFAFPLVLWLGGLWRDSPGLRGSMSAYYHSAMRDWFVGALFAIGACLYLYKGFTSKENLLLNLAALFAVGVAIFPMGWPPKNWPPQGWPNEPLCNTFTAGYVHVTCAVLAFLCIALVCWFCASDTLPLMQDPARREKFHRAYLWLGIAMLVSPLIAVALKFTLGQSSYVFLAELTAMYVFAAYWLVKSREIAATKAEKKALMNELAMPAAPPTGTAVGAHG